MPAAESPYIAWLGRAGADSTALGGKGASLDRLVTMGFRVPPGFCVTTAAFRLQREAIPDAGAADLATKITAAPLEGEIDDALQVALEALARELSALGPAPSFAVRSSAIGEDGSAASYAGLHDTELGVELEEVPAAVRRCWASLWSPPAAAYRTRRGLDDADAAMAVVVQALVPADAAAVAFTRHPVTGRDDQLVITGVRGLGDEMVAGTVTPDTWVIDRATRSVLTFDPGASPHGAALDATELASLVDLCLEVEARFGAPVDIEAAVAGGQWYLLQARPITTGNPAGATAGAAAGATA